MNAIESPIKSWEIKITFQATDAERERIERRLLDSRLFCSSGWFRHLFLGRIPGVKCKEFFFASSGPAEIEDDEPDKTSEKLIY